MRHDKWEVYREDEDIAFHMSSENYSGSQHPRALHQNQDVKKLVPQAQNRHDQRRSGPTTPSSPGFNSTQAAIH